MEHQVDFTRNGYRIFAVLHQPDSPVRGGVLFSHGFGGNKSEVGRLFVKTARKLADKGIASLRFDFVGCGDSEGDSLDASILTEVEDALAAYRFFQERTSIPASRLGLLGYSLGGAVTALLSSQVEAKAIVLWAPVSDPLRVFSGHLDITPEELLKRDGYDGGPHQVGRRFVQELADLKPMESLSQFQGAFLTIHGAEDTVVLPENSDRCLQAVESVSNNAQKIVIPGAGHGFYAPEQSEELITQTVQWFDRYLAPSD